MHTHKPDAAPLSSPWNTEAIHLATPQSADAGANRRYAAPRVTMLANRRRRDEQADSDTPDTRERELCSEHLMRLGTLAAGAAHELAQPLSSLAVVVGELEARCARRADRDDLRELIGDMTRHLRHCRETLGSMLSYGRETFDGPAEWVAADEFARLALEAFLARRPEAQVTLRVATPGPAPHLRRDPGLRQALLNLLGNGADVSPGWVALSVAWDDQTLRLNVYDRGPGLMPDVAEQVGRLFFTTKPPGSGNGLGLCLAQTAVTRLGGSLRLTNGEQGGACAEIMLPAGTMAEKTQEKGHGSSRVVTLPVASASAPQRLPTAPPSPSPEALKT